jgi:hypothetical protein
MTSLQVETVRCALACRERRLHLNEISSGVLPELLLPALRLAGVQSTIGPQQIIESRTEVNQIFIDNKVKDCFVCTTASLNPPAQKSALAFLFAISRVALLRTLSSGKWLDSVAQTINFKEQPP